MPAKNKEGEARSRSLGGLNSLHAKAAHPLEWLLEPLEEFPSYLRRKMFGCEAAYLNGKLTIVLAAGEEPWNGILIATAREFHPSLCQEWARLRSHPVLGKWLYLSQADPEFESIALALVECVRQGDSRIGVEPKPRKRGKTGKKRVQSKRQRRSLL